MLNLQERLTLNALRIKYTKRGRKTGYARVYNTRPNYCNLIVYRSLERAGYIEILTVDNATTENMLYGMSHITFTLKD